MRAINILRTQSSVSKFSEIIYFLRIIEKINILVK